MIRHRTVLESLIAARNAAHEGQFVHYVRSVDNDQISTIVFASGSFDPIQRELFDDVICTSR